MAEALFTLPNQANEVLNDIVYLKEDVPLSLARSVFVRS